MKSLIKIIRFLTSDNERILQKKIVLTRQILFFRIQHKAVIT